MNEQTNDCPYNDPSCGHDECAGGGVCSYLGLPSIYDVPDSGEAKVPQTFEEWRHAAQSKQHPFSAEFHMANCPSTCRDCRDAWESGARAQAARDAKTIKRLSDDRERLRQDALTIRQLVSASDRCVWTSVSNQPCERPADSLYHRCTCEVSRNCDRYDCHAFVPESTLDAVRRAETMRRMYAELQPTLLANEFTAAARDRMAERIAEWIDTENRKQIQRYPDRVKVLAAIIDEERRR